MHPTIARYMDLSQALDTLEKSSTDATLDAEEAAFLAAAVAAPQSRNAVLSAAGKKKANAETEQHLIILAVRAATHRLASDPRIGPRIDTARAALLKEGANEEEATGLIAQCVLEEAFGYAEDPDSFDANFVAETLESLPYLAAVNQDTIDAWLEEFAKAGPDRELRLKVAEAVLESAWSEGPQPISPEHLDEALEVLGDTVADSEFAKATQTVEQLLSFLLDHHVIGRERHERLTHLVKSAAHGGADPAELDSSEQEED